MIHCLLICLYFLSFVSEIPPPPKDCEPALLRLRCADMQIWFLLKIAFSFGSIAAGQQRWDSSSLAAGHKPPPPQYPSPPPAADGMRNKGSPGALSSPKQPKNPTSTSTTDHEPCAQLAAIANSMMAANPKGGLSWTKVRNTADGEYFRSYSGSWRIGL